MDKLETRKVWMSKKQKTNLVLEVAQPNNIKSSVL